MAYDAVAPVTKTPPVVPSDQLLEDYPAARSTPATSGPVVQPATDATDAIKEVAVVYGKTIEQRYRAKVVRIVDGDTVVVLNDANKQIKVRLENQNWVGLMLDGIRLSKDQLAVVALGITAEGFKFVLDFELGSSESVEVSLDLMRRLDKRGFSCERC